MGYDLSECLPSKTTHAANIGEAVEKRETFHTVGGMQIGAATVEKYMDVSQKTKTRVTTWSSNSTAGYILNKQTNKQTPKKEQPTKT